MKDFKINLRFFIIAIGVVLVWRGVWGLADMYVFAENELLSYVASVGIGAAIILLLHEKLNDIF